VRRTASVALAALIMLGTAYGIVAAWDWPEKAKIFPLAIGIPLFCLAAVEAAWSLLGSERRGGEARDFQLSAEGHGTRRAAVAVAWMLGFFAAIVLLGFPYAVPLFVFVYLKLQGRESWTLSIVMTVAVWGVFYGLFDRLLHLPFATGWLLGFLR
jgi:hypothetical protein